MYFAVYRHYARRQHDLIYRTPGRAVPPSTGGNYRTSTDDLQGWKGSPGGNSFCSGVDRDGYTHIWERPLPTPATAQQQQQQQCNMADSSSCPTGLIGSRTPAELSLLHRGSAEIAAATVPLRSGAGGGYFVVGNGGGGGGGGGGTDDVHCLRSLDSIDNQRYYQLDPADGGPSTPT